MADSLTREELSKFLPTHRAVRAWEGIAADASAVAQAQATADQGVADAATAQGSANAAQTSANAAQASANAAQVNADALELPQYLTLALSATLTNERTLALGIGLKGTDGGANNPYTLDRSDVISILGADVADVTAAFVDATGLLIALAANATYLIDGLVTFQAAAVTTGIALGFTLPAGAAISGAYQHNTTASAIEGSYNIASGAVKGNTSGVLTANDNVPISGRWVITTAATPGNAQLQFRTEVAASAVTLKAFLSALVARRIA